MALCKSLCLLLMLSTNPGDGNGNISVLVIPGTMVENVLPGLQHDAMEPSHTHHLIG